MTHTQPERLRCEVCDMPTLGDTLCNQHYEEQEKMTHTKGPWAVRYANNLTAIVTPKGEMQLSLHGVYDGLKPLSVSVQEWKANAAFIVRACNSYEAMLEALKLAVTIHPHNVTFQEAIRLAEGRG